MQGYGQQPTYNPQLMEAIAQQEQLRQRQQNAQNMMQPSGGAGGVYDILGAVLGGVMSNKLGKQASQGEADINQQIQAFQAQKAQEAEQRATQKAIAKRDEERLYQKGIAEQKHKQAIELKKMYKPNTTTINMPGAEKESETMKKLAGVDATSFGGWRDDAIMAQQSQNTIDQLRPLLASMDTGYTQEKYAIASKLWGGKQAQNYENVQAKVGDLVMTELNKMKGSAQLAERQYIEGLQADYGKTPEANQKIMDYITSKNTMSIDRFSQAQDHLRQNKNLFDFMPSNNQKIYGKEQAPQQTIDYSKKTNEELMAEWQARQKK